MELDFNKLGGLLPAIVQDASTGRVLMLGFMNAEAFQKTLETGCAVFYSRSRNKLWLKGETSGHRLMVKEISTDCDLDAVLVKVEALGPGDDVAQPGEDVGLDEANAHLVQASVLPRQRQGRFVEIDARHLGGFPHRLGINRETT